MSTITADVVVIGLGPGGEEVAGRLAGAGLRVVGAERELVGGECPYWGCVPSKMIIRGADLLAEARRVPGVSGATTVTPDFGPVARRIRAEATDNWDDTVAVERLERKGGRFVRGSARCDGPRRVLVEAADGPVTVEVEQAVVLATGTRPAVPPVEGLAGTPYWTNRDILKVLDPPASLTVLGGGAIGLELAQAMSRYGSRVNVVEGLPRLLPLEEPEVSAVIEKRLRAEGLEVRTGLGVNRVEYRDGGGFTLYLDGAEPVTSERLLVATGRRAHLEELGLETVGLDPGARVLSVDEHMRAGEGVWGVGDVTGVGAFTHIAMYQAAICADALLGKDNPGADYRGLARVTFTDPEVGSVGLSEEAARAQGLRVAVGSAKVSSSARGWIHGPGNEGLIKVVCDADRGVLVGATSCGPWGGEVLSMLTLAVHAQTPVATLRRMIYAYPTFHRGVEDALRDLDA